MKNLDNIAKKIEKKLDDKEKLRETAIKQCRDIIRTCRKAISGIHGCKNVDKELNEGLKIVIEVKKSLSDYPDLAKAGYIENASQELVEASCLLSILQGKPLPTPEELNVSYSSFLLGLGDVVGELRRTILDRLKKGDIEKADEIFEIMETIYNILMRFDYPSALVPIKKKQDIARQLIERTRGEMLMTNKNWALEKKLEEIKKVISKSEKKPKKQRESPQEDDFGLDIDSVWK